MEDKIVSTLRMPVEVKEKLQKASYELGISCNELILIAIAKYLDYLSQ